MMLAVDTRVEPRTALSRAADQLIPCRHLLVLAGAGLSADAGVPTFRGEDGLWRSHKVEDLATPEGFRRAPDLVWAWYHERRAAIANAQPHAGQRALALLQRHFRATEVLVATTNEDDLLERAGVRDVLHLHGSLFDTICAAGCGWRLPDDRGINQSLRPCPSCGAPVRPGSVWYGEPLPAAPFQVLSDFHPDGCLLLGSSCLVAPVSTIPVELAIAGVPVVEINTQETPVSEAVTCTLRGSAKDLLPGLVDLLTSTAVQDQRRRLT